MLQGINPVTMNRRTDMRICLAAVALLASAGSAAAEGCEALGLQSSYLTELYCSELEALAEDNEATRSVTEGETVSEPEDPFLRNIEVIREAYRADPKKTLALIARIRNAGGLAGD